MVSKTRAMQLGKRLRQEMAEILLREVSDPRLRMVTVTDVEVDRELAYATVYVTAVDAEERGEEILQALEGAQGFLRRELATRVRLRSFPQLRFRRDFSPEQGSRIDRILDQLRDAEESGGSASREG
jgi:ribosome-binding factor A